MIMLAPNHELLLRQQISHELAAVLQGATSGGWVIEMDELEILLMIDVAQKCLTITTPALEMKRLDDHVVNRLCAPGDADCDQPMQCIEFAVHGDWLWVQCRASTESVTTDELAGLVQLVGEMTRNCRCFRPPLQGHTDQVGRPPISLRRGGRERQ